MEAKNLDVKEDQLMDNENTNENNPAALADRLRWMADAIDRVCTDAVRDSRVYYEIQTRTEEGPGLRVSAFQRHREVIAWAERCGRQRGEPEPGGYGDTRWVTMDYVMGDLPVEVTLFAYTDAEED